MPLIQGKTNNSRSKNIEELINSGKPAKQAEAIAYSVQNKNKAKDSLFAKNDNISSRDYDMNNFMEIIGNPISKTGVFPYSGKQIGHRGLEPDRIYNVLRKGEELNNPETIDSFKLLPFTDEHTMLGSSDEGLTPAEKKGVHGVTGENVYFEEPYLKANVKIFSDKLKSLIDSGKKELSIGYRCIYEPESGTYDGQTYDFVQKQIRGNHLALVDEGRSGHDVAVLDHFKFTFDEKELKMLEKRDHKGDMSKPLDKAKDNEEMTLKECYEMMDKIKNRLEMIDGKDKFEDDMEAEEINESENDVIDEEGEYKKFVNRADVTADEDIEESEKEDKKAKMEEREELSKKAAHEGDMKDMKDRRDSKDEDMYKDEHTGRKEGAMDSAMKRVLREISVRDSLANQLAKHIGVFDHKEKTVAEVASYGLKKLGLNAKKGHEESVLAGFLAGARPQSMSIAQDSRQKSSAIDAYIGGK